MNSSDAHTGVMLRHVYLMCCVVSACDSGLCWYRRRASAAPGTPASLAGTGSPASPLSAEQQKTFLAVRLSSDGHPFAQLTKC